MMKIMRKYAKRLLIIVALFIIPAFILWGAGSALRSKSSNKHAGKIFGEKISLKEYSKSWQACRNQALMLYGQNLNKVSKFLDLEQQAWERLILLKEAKRKGITVKDEKVINTIKNMSFFQKNGKFNQESYNTILQYVFKTKPRTFENQIRNTLKIQKLSQQALSDIKITEKELKQAYKRKNEKVKVSYILLPYSNYKTKIQSTDKELKEFYNSNQSQFKEPKKIQVKYIPILYKNIQKKVNVTPDEIKKYFQKNKQKLTSTENKKDSLDKKLKKDIKETLQDEKTKNKAKELGNKISDFLIQTPDLKKAGKKFSLPVKKTDYFTHNEPISDIGWSYNFTQKAFSLKEGEISDMVKVEPKGLYFIQLLEKKESGIPKFTDIKQKVKSRYVNRKAKDLAKKDATKKLEKLNKLLQKKIDWDKAIKKIGVTSTTTSYFKRGDYIKDIGYSEDFIKASFTSPEGKIYKKPISTPKGYCLIKPISKKSIDQNAFKEQKKEFRKNYLSNKRQQHYKKWLDNLIQRANLQSNLDEIRKESKKRASNRS